MSGLSPKEKEALNSWAKGWLAHLGAPNNFDAAVSEKLKSGLSYGEAVDQAAKERPDLYDKYRTGQS